jgi:hypothetical protein
MAWQIDNGLTAAMQAEDVDGLGDRTRPTVAGQTVIWHPEGRQALSEVSTRVLRGACLLKSMSLRHFTVLPRQAQSSGHNASTTASGFCH